MSWNRFAQVRNVKLLMRNLMRLGFSFGGIVTMLVMKLISLFSFRYKIGYIWTVKMLQPQNLKNALTC